jgi:hypothetical protein
MNRIVFIVLIFTLFLSTQIFAQHFDLPEPIYNDTNNAEVINFAAVAAFAQAASSDANNVVIPNRIRNNTYFLESVRLKTLAQDSYDSGDYDVSTTYAAESLRYAQLSDEYVALQLKMKEADDMIARAREGGAWVVARGLDKVYPDEYAQGQALYIEATDARSAEDWDGAIDAARRILVMLDGAQDSLPLPAQYTVRTWNGEKDCLWNIAGYSWVYGDARQWKRLYEANKSKFPEPDNPNWIEPGIVLDIPSVNNETRQGIWKQGLSYPDY